MPDRPTPGQLEQRTAPEAAAPEVDGRRLHGLIPYSVESRDMGGWREIIEPGALADADLSDLIATREHDRSRLLGRHPATLTVEDRADGFAWSVELPQSPVGEDVRVAVERGDLRSTSWRMVVAKDRWDGNVRHVEAIAELRDVCVTAAPAYGDAHAEYRAAPQPEPEESAVPDPVPTPTPTPGLSVEDRSVEPPSIESRVIDALRSINKGEARSLNTTTASAVTPEEQASYLWDRLRPASVMLSAGVRVIPTSREKVVWPRLTADVAPDWYAEEEVIAAGDPSFSTLEATPHKLAHRVEMSNEVIDDSEPSIVEILNSHLATMLALKLDASMLVGNPASNPDSIRGLKFVPGIQTISMGDNGGALTDYDPFIEAIGMLRAANVPGPYAVVANARELTSLELLREATGSNLQLAAPVGLPPIYTTTQLPLTETKGTASDASSAYVFSPSEIVLVRRYDAQIELDRSRLFDKDMSEMRGKLRADLVIPNPVAVVQINGIIPAA